MHCYALSSILCKGCRPPLLGCAILKALASLSDSLRACSHPACSRLPKPQLPPSSSAAIHALDNLLLMLRSRVRCKQAPCSALRRLTLLQRAYKKWRSAGAPEMHPSVNKRSALLPLPRSLSLPMRDSFRGSSIPTGPAACQRVPRQAATSAPL